MSSTTLELNAPVSDETRSNQRELWRRYSKSGHGSAIENKIVEQYLPLVKAVVGRLAMTLPSHVNSDDLYSAGLVGLLNAVRRFDLKSGSSFEHYARVRIRGAVFDELRRLDWVPRSVHEKAKKVESVMQELSQRNGNVPTDMEMAKALNLSLDEYEELVEEIRPASYVCLDSATNGDSENGSGSYDFIADDSQTEPWEGTARREMSSLIEERLKQLPEMQRKVLALYYFEDLRLREIAEAFGVTESRICQIHSQAILAIKALLKKQDPETFNHC
ncbi:MAG TPA: FliA/WhiG family RNA polymerase sigma factor [Verrucomicrobiae bacterium]|jgi:RNA polymerase sigma factor for flagellar operon FliA|nr:FliA/WhiG family RNA polymerase sigma factor [Verrucomicrobiae bacterium]